MQEDFIDINDFAGEAPADQAAEVEKLEDAPAEASNDTDSSEAAPESNAPRRVIGVITGKEIEEAEDYDVFSEVEKRVEEIEREPEKKERRSFLSSVKSFGEHCRYFATNLKREIRHKRAVSKRSKAEEERKAIQAESSPQKPVHREVRRESNGLVKVHSRDDRPRNKEQL